MSTALAFQSTTFDVIDRDGLPWIQSRQLATALGYKDERSVHKIYERNRDEFTGSMVGVVNLTTPLGGNQEYRIFSLRGCHLIAMLARTQIAKAFRVWVLDVLETLNKAKALPESLTPSTADDRKPLRSLVFAWSRAAGVHVDTCWPQVKAYFQLSRLDDMPVEWIPDALTFVQGKIDALSKALPVREPLALPPAHTAKDVARERWLDAYASFLPCQSAAAAGPHKVFHGETRNLKSAYDFATTESTALEVIQDLLSLRAYLDAAITSATIVAQRLTV